MPRHDRTGTPHQRYRAGLPSRSPRLHGQRSFDCAGRLPCRSEPVSRPNASRFMPRANLLLLSVGALLIPGCTPAPEPDTTPPNDVLNALVIAGDWRTAIEWTNPSDPDFYG